MDLTDNLKEIEEEISRKRQYLVVVNEEILMQDFGLYRHIYSFATSDWYKERLAEIRKNQK